MINVIKTIKYGKQTLGTRNTDLVWNSLKLFFPFLHEVQNYSYTVVHFRIHKDVILLFRNVRMNRIH